MLAFYLVKIICFHLFIFALCYLTARHGWSPVEKHDTERKTNQHYVLEYDFVVHYTNVPVLQELPPGLFP